MSQRQEYLRQTQRQDYKLNDLYDQETKRVAALDAWRQSVTAPRDGLVSFYLDGYESDLRVDTLESLTAEQIHAVLQGRALTGSEAVSRLNTGIFRVVSTDKWYIVLLSNDATWNPTNNQSYTFQLEGYPDPGLYRAGDFHAKERGGGHGGAGGRGESRPTAQRAQRPGRHRHLPYRPVGAPERPVHRGRPDRRMAGRRGGVHLHPGGGALSGPQQRFDTAHHAGTLSVGQRVLIR